MVQEVLSDTILRQALRQAKAADRAAQNPPPAPAHHGKMSRGSSFAGGHAPFVPPVNTTGYHPGLAPAQIRSPPRKEREGVSSPRAFYTAPPKVVVEAEQHPFAPTESTEPSDSLDVGARSSGD